MPLNITPTSPPTSTRSAKTPRFAPVLAEITAVIAPRWQQVDVVEAGLPKEGEESAACAVKLAAAIREAGNALPDSYYRAVALGQVVKFCQLEGKNPYVGRKKASE